MGIGRIMWRRGESDERSRLVAVNDSVTFHHNINSVYIFCIKEVSGCSERKCMPFHLKTTMEKH